MTDLGDPWEGVPADKRLDFAVIREPLEKLAAGTILSCARSWTPSARSSSSLTSRRGWTGTTSSGWREMQEEYGRGCSSGRSVSYFKSIEYDSGAV